MKWTIICLIVLPMLFAFNKRSDDFYYVSLVLDISVPDKKLSLIKSKKLNLKTLSKNSIVPFSYLLETKDYNIRFEIIEESTFPSMRVFLKPTENHLDLKLRFKRNMNQKGKTGICSSFYEYEDKDALGFDMTWKVSCNEHIKDKTINFDVITSSGELIGTETIEFNLVKDGKYWFVVAL